MALIKLGLTRDQFASFLQDFEQIKQFEKLFTTVDDNTNNEIPSIAINAGNAGEAANDALAQVAALAELLALVDTAPRAELGTLAALQQSNVPSLTFDNAPEVIPTAIGSVYWDGGTTLGVQMTANIVGRVNEDQFYYIKASAAITKGQVIMFDGAVGASGVIKGKPATGVTNGAYIMGIAAESIANNGFGLVQAFGSLRGINTSTFSDGDILWYDPAVTGGLTKTEPVAPNVKVQVAAVTNAANNGSIAIRVTAGSVLGGTDSNVQFGPLSNKDMIQYDAAAGYWKNVAFVPVTVANGGTGATSLTSGYLLKGNGTSAVSASIVYDNGSSVGIGTNSPSYKLDVATIPLANNQSGSVRFGYNDQYGMRLRQNIDNTGVPYVSVIGPKDTNGWLTFNTGSSDQERMRIDANGNVRVGSGALATTATDGFLYIPTCAGTPTGTPTTVTGLAPMVADSTNNKLYVYLGGAWQPMN